MSGPRCGTHSQRGLESDAHQVQAMTGSLARIRPRRISRPTYPSAMQVDCSNDAFASAYPLHVLYRIRIHPPTVPLQIIVRPCLGPGAHAFSRTSAQSPPLNLVIHASLHVCNALSSCMATAPHLRCAFRGARVRPCSACSAAVPRNRVRRPLHSPRPFVFRCIIPFPSPPRARTASAPAPAPVPLNRDSRHCPPIAVRRLRRTFCARRWALGIGWAPEETPGPRDCVAD